MRLAQLSCCRYGRCYRAVCGEAKVERAGPISARQRYGGLCMAGKKALLDEQVVITG